MSNSADQNQVITQYLLGTLSESERERLDELSVTNEEFADSLNAGEKDLIDSYVQGELSGATLAQFKSHYLASASGRQRVEFAEAFQVFAKKQTVSSGSTVRGLSDLDGKQKRGWFSWLAELGGRHPALQWGMALTAVVFIIVGVLLSLQNARLREQVSIERAHLAELQQRETQLQNELTQQRSSNTTIEQELAQVREERARMEEELRKSGNLSPTETTVASLVLTPQLRGDGQAKSLSMSDNASRVNVQLRLEPNEYQTFTVALLDQSHNQELWRSGKLKASSRADERNLNVSFSASLLKAQGYTLRVTGVSANGQSEVVGDYTFKVLKHQASEN